MDETEVVVGAGASEGEDSQLGVGIAIGLVVGLIVGWLVGTRAKQLAAATKAIPKALASLTKTKRNAASSASGAGANGAGSAAAQAAAAVSVANDVDAEPTPPEDEVLPDDDDVVNAFLNSNSTPGLDDHCDLEFNPVVLYQIKRAKEGARIAKIRDQMIAEGLDPDDDSQMAMISQPVGRTKISALAVLVAHGASVSRVRSDTVDQAQKEQRRTLKTVEVYLTKQLEVDASRTQNGLQNSKRVGISLQQISALEVALHSSQYTPRFSREKRQINIATAARDQLREVQRTRPLPVHSQSSSSFEDLFGAGDGVAERVSRRGAEAISLDDLAAIQAEMGEMEALEGEDA